MSYNDRYFKVTPQLCKFRIKTLKLLASGATKRISE